MAISEGNVSTSACLEGQGAAWLASRASEFQHCVVT